MNGGAPSGQFVELEKEGPLNAATNLKVKRRLQTRTERGRPLNTLESVAVNQKLYQV